MSISQDKNTMTTDSRIFELSNRIYNILLNKGYENLNRRELELLALVSKIYNEEVNERK